MLCPMSQKSESVVIIVGGGGWDFIKTILIVYISRGILIFIQHITVRMEKRSHIDNR